jgi:cellobiose phosphorylase
LAPGESKKIVFILGYVEVDPDKKFIAPNLINKETRRKKLIASFNTPEKAEQALALVKKHWDDLLGVFHVETGDEKLDRMANIWNQYQCMITFCMSRSASYYESGIGRGMGFRDSCQDLLGFLHIIPDKAKNNGLLTSHPSKRKTDRPITNISH